MKKSIPICTNLFKYILFLALLSGGVSVLLFAQETDNEDKTYSPRFYIPDSDTTLDALPLKSTGAEVNIVGVIAMRCALHLF